MIEYIISNIIKYFIKSLGIKYLKTGNYLDGIKMNVTDDYDKLDSIQFEKIDSDGNIETDTKKPLKYNDEVYLSFNDNGKKMYITDNPLQVMIR